MAIQKGDDLLSIGQQGFLSEENRFCGILCYNQLGVPVGAILSSCH